MSTLWRVLPFCLVAGIFLFFGTAARAAESVHLELFPIQDMASYRNIKLFSGPLTPAERAKFFPGGEAPSAVNVFLLKVNGKIILIDAGYGSNTQAKGATLQTLKDMGIKPEQVDMILLTHMHGDHITGLLQGDKAVYPKAKIFASKPEAGFWLAPETLTSEYGERAKTARTVAKAYEGRFTTFDFNTTVAPGITALGAPGHTPGHTMFMLADGKDKVLIIGDLVHAVDLQFAYPDECPAYDMDRNQAIAVRKEVLKQAAAEKLLLGGMHIPGGGLGYAQENGKGGYKFVPFKGE